MNNLTDERFADLVIQGEGQRMEFKESVSKDLGREFVAFANANGGAIIIGVGDKGGRHGIDVDNATRSKIQDIALKCDPPVHCIIDDWMDADGRAYWLLHIPEGNNKPYRSTGGFYLRQGPNSVKLTTDEIVAFIQEEGRVQFDSRAVKTKQWDKVLNADLIQRYKSLVGTQAHTEAMLYSIGAIEGAWPTQAGILMFATNPVEYMPQSMVRCVAYAGTEKVDILDSKDFDKDLISNIEEVIVFLKRHLNTSRSVIGLEGRTVLELPEEVLREAVVNALMHRDYFIQGAHVMVEVFKDRIVISNPGSLPKGLTEKDFGTRSLTRNPTLADMLLRTPYIEKLGTGIPRMRSNMKKAGLKEPQFTFNGFFTIELNRSVVGDPVSDPVNGRESGLVNLDDITDSQWVMLMSVMSGQVSDPVSDPVKMRLVKELKAIVKAPHNRSSLSKEINEPVDTVKRDLRLLRQWGITQFIGAPKTGSYKMTKTAIEQLKEVRTISNDS